MKKRERKDEKTKKKRKRLIARDASLLGQERSVTQVDDAVDVPRDAT